MKRQLCYDVQLPYVKYGKITYPFQTQFNIHFIDFLSISILEWKETQILLFCCTIMQGLSFKFYANFITAYKFELSRALFYIVICKARIPYLRDCIFDRYFERSLIFFLVSSMQSLFPIYCTTQQNDDQHLTTCPHHCF